MSANDFRLGIDRLVPGYKATRDKTYADLQRTWADERELPSERDILDAAAVARAETVDAEAAEAAALQADIDALDTADDTQLRAILKRRLLGVQATREGGR
jgi:hypothetical protein